MNRSAKIFGILILLMFACNQEKVDNSSQYENSPEIRMETYVSGYEIIWGMDFLPDSTLIFTEKKGNIYRKDGDNITMLSGFPEVLAKSQGGLLDVKVHPNYADNGWIYASYSAEGTSGNGQLNLIRFRINEDQVTNVETIFSTDASNSWNGHYGSRIMFDKESHLFLSIGEGGNTTYAGPNKKNNNALELNSPWGKIHRLNDDGTIPGDNPVFESNNEPTSVWSYGHRNPQGMDFHPATGELWISEHGPKGGDELNIVRSKANYGWPDYSLGTNYDGTEISGDHTAQGITEPVFSWIPSIGTCGMTFISGSDFDFLEGNLLVSGLVTESLHRCVVSNGKVTEMEPLLKDVGRVRDVAQAPDGSIYVSVENPGRIIRITPE
jgi:glucose/arabinose dehydrogenase